MIVGNWMQTPPMTIGSDMLVAEAKRLISENSLHALPVVEKDGRMALLSSPCPAHRSTHSASAWLAPSTPPSTRSKGTAISACSTKEALSKCSVPEPAWPKCETLRLAAVAEIGGAAMGAGLGPVDIHVSQIIAATKHNMLANDSAAHRSDIAESSPPPSSCELESTFPSPWVSLMSTRPSVPSPNCRLICRGLA